MYTKINTYVINLKKDKQLPKRFIYKLRPIKLKTLKTNLKINLVNSFIYFFKFFTDVLILFDQKFSKWF